MLTLAQKHTASPRSEAHSRGPRFQEAIGKPISILNGKGFDPAAGKELFARFLQASTKLTRCINVTKDGRRLSHDAVLSKQNNGQIKCLSTNFTLAAPANLCLVDYYERERRSSASDASAGTVLISDTIAAAVRQRLLSDYYELERRTSAMDLAIGSANKIRYGVDVTTPNPKRLRSA